MRREAVTHSLHPQHPNPPALQPCHDPSGHTQAVPVMPPQAPVCSAQLGPDTGGLNSPPAPLSIQGEWQQGNHKSSPGRKCSNCQGKLRAAVLRLVASFPIRVDYHSSQQQSQALLFVDFLKPQNGPFRTGTGEETHPNTSQLHHEHASLTASLQDGAWAAIRAGCWGTAYSSGNRWFVWTTHIEALVGCCSPTY